MVVFQGVFGRFQNSFSVEHIWTAASNFWAGLPHNEYEEKIQPQKNTWEDYKVDGLLD